MRKAALYLRIFHGLVLVYFTAGLFYLYYIAFTGNVNELLFRILTVTMALELSAVFLMNGGDCPLIHVQRRLGDEKPFFELVFPKRIAKFAIQGYTALGMIALVFILFRFVVSS